MKPGAHGKPLSGPSEAFFICHGISTIKFTTAAETYRCGCSTTTTCPWQCLWCPTPTSFSTIPIKGTCGWEKKTISFQRLRRSKTKEKTHQLVCTGPATFFRTLTNGISWRRSGIGVRGGVRSSCGSLATRWAPICPASIPVCTRKDTSTAPAASSSSRREKATRFFGRKGRRRSSVRGMRPRSSCRPKTGITSTSTWERNRPATSPLAHSGSSVAKARPWRTGPICKSSTRTRTLGYARSSKRSSPSVATPV